MNLPKLQIITEPVRELHPDTRLILTLMEIKKYRKLDAGEQKEYDDAWLRTDQRIAAQLAADKAHDLQTESRSFPESKVNFHE